MPAGAARKTVFNDDEFVKCRRKRQKKIDFDDMLIKTYDLLKLGVEYTKYSEGYFNIFVGEITDFWDEVFKEAYNFGDISLDPYYSNEQKEKLDSLVKAIPITNEEIVIFSFKSL